MDQTLSGSPELIPYPDWRSNTVGDCQNGLNTVYRIKSDKCGRLWVLDTGTIGIGNTTQQVCPYSVNIFDLTTNTRIRRYELRPEDTNANTFIANTVIDIGKSCDDTFAYFSDELGYGLIAYSFEQNKSWRFAHSFFFPDPLRGDFNVAGLNFQWGEEGIFGIALSPIKSDGYRTLYFSPLASHREFSVSTRVLRDESRVEDSFHDFQFLEERAGNAHTTSRVISEDGVMLFNLIDQNAIGCWHSSMPYTPQFHGIVDRDDVGLVFPADVKIDENQDVWIISDRMPVFLIAELDYSDVNYRIYSAPLAELIHGTVCDISSSTKHYNLPKFGYTQPPLPPSKSRLHTTNKPVGLGAFKDAGRTENIFEYSTSPKLLPSYSVREPKSHLYTSQVLQKPYQFAEQHLVSNTHQHQPSSPHEFTSGIHSDSPKASWWSRHLY